MTITAQAGEFAVAIQPAKYEEGRHFNVRARGHVTFTALPAANSTINVAGQTFTFVAAAPAAAGEIRIGATIPETLERLANAVNGMEDANVHSATPASLHVTATTEGNRIYFTALNGLKSVGNALALSTTVTGTTVVPFGGGINGAMGLKAFGRIVFTGQPAANDEVDINGTTYRFVSAAPAAYTASTVEVRIGATLKQTVERLARAINNTGVPGTDYSTGTPAHSTVYSDINLRDKVVTIWAKSVGVAGNSIALAKTGANITISGATLAGGLDVSTFPMSSLSWVRMRAVEVSYGEMQMQDVLPLEVGGNITPTGAYKQGIAVGGGATVMPRLEGSIGHLLLAALGSSTTVVNNGVGVHTFTFGQNEIDIPWLAVRRMIPGRDSVFGHGVIGMDNKLNMLRTTVQATAPIQMEAQFIGRVPIASHHPEVWEGASFEDFESIPLACKGSFKLPEIPGMPSRNLPVTAVVVELANATTGPREEMIVGSYYLDDVVPLTRALTFTATYKWQDPALYNLLLTSSATGKDWNPQPFITQTTNGEPAIELIVESPYSIPGTSTPYSLRIIANKVFWQQQGNVVLRPGQIVMMQLVGTVLYDSGGYCRFILTNGRTTPYTIPSEP